MSEGKRDNGKIAQLAAMVAAAAALFGGVLMLYQMTVAQRATAESGVEQAKMLKSLAEQAKSANALTAARSETARFYSELAQADRIATRRTALTQTLFAMKEGDWVSHPRMRAEALTALVDLELVNASLENGKKPLGLQLQSVSAPGADLRGRDLRGINFTGAKLTVADLDGADLTGAKLDRADLRGASLEDIKIAGATFDGVLFDAATKWPAGFNADSGKLHNVGPNVELEGADLSGADLRDGFFIGTVFEDCNLRGTRLEGAECDKDTRFRPMTHLCIGGRVVVNASYKP